MNEARYLEYVVRITYSICVKYEQGILKDKTLLPRKIMVEYIGYAPVDFYLPVNSFL